MYGAGKPRGTVDRVVAVLRWQRPSDRNSGDRQHLADKRDADFRFAARDAFGNIAATAALTLQNNRTLVALFRAERRNRVLATTDSLTGLPNRAGLIAELNRLRTAATDGQDGEITSLFVDLDSFKAVNDRFGHSAGDRVLAAAAARLRAVAAPHFVCRLGGDEFVVVMNSSDRAVATFVARHIAERMREPIEGCAAEPVLIGASIGVAFGSIANRDAEQILAEADMALYLAKDAGGGRHAIGGGRRISA